MSEEFNYGPKVSLIERLHCTYVISTHCLRPRALLPIF